MSLFSQSQSLFRHAGKEFLKRRLKLLKEGISVDPYMSVLIMLTISFPEAMIASYFAIQLIGGRPKIVEIVLIGLIQSVLADIVRSMPIPIGLHTILQALSLISLIFIIARVPFLVIATGVILVLIVNIMVEVFVAQLLLGLTGMTFDQVINHEYMRIVFFIPTAFAMIITILVFKRYNITFLKLTRWRFFENNSIAAEKEEGFMHREILPALIFVFLPIFLLYILNFTHVSIYFKDHSGELSAFFKVLLNVLITMLAFISIWAVRKISSTVEKEYEAKKAAETIEQIKGLILSIRKQRHDFNHHLQTVYGLIETGSQKEAREYIQKTYHYVAGTGELIKTDNLGISAHLYTKILISETRNILFNINIECSLEEFPLKGNEASSLLGNLIDNAFDEVEKYEAGVRDVRLDIRAERGEYLLEVANRGNLDQQTASRIFDTNFTTKKGHAGLGLAIVKDIVERYRGSIQVSSEGGETVFRVMIPYRR